MVALNWPVILVVGSYLGSISHTLTALETLRTNGLKVAALVVSESFPADVSLADTAMALENFVPLNIPIVKIPRLQDGAEKWKDAPNISWIIESERNESRKI
jgi:dethiobiotin synthetase